MPLNVRRLYTSVLLVLFGLVFVAHAQTVEQTPAAPVQAPTSGDIMRGRISKAKAFIVVRNYNAAIYELENIRKESGDIAVQSVVTVLLMNSYLEQGDYKRAQDMLNQFYTAQKTANPNAAASYAAVAGQVIKGGRSRAERYRALGLNVADRTLPLEALNDLEKMRETLELVITQSKEIGKGAAKPADSMALLEEAVNSRTMLARDDYDARHWKDEVADTREEMANSRTVVLNAGGDPIADVPNSGVVAGKTNPPVMQPVVDTKTTRDREVKTVETNAVETSAAESKPVYIPSAPPTVKEEPKTTETPKAETAPSGGPIDVGSLVAYATQRTPPIYPPAARTMRTTGVVKVEVTVNETGDVSEVQKTSGPPMLQNAAKDAVKKWKFKPFVRGGQPVKATGFVSFNFNL
ncbi:MAG: TonB family protein [Pyrinomonadaceae bacterium]